ncbi:MAG: hypothetical protein EP343_04970 [Deltaproteobacteria bacterium]|nr:MAG: hypothetical protein EP343_04970 [Deltaproteobacteria bacterium]
MPGCGPTSNSNEVNQETQGSVEATADASPDTTASVEPTGSESSLDAGGQGSESTTLPEPSSGPEPGPEATPQESSMKTCTFNADCPTGERCECDEQTGCFCKVGQRGTGKSGVDVCTTGNDCETALCNEGSDGNFYCSGPCESDSDCQSKLPICSNITFLGKVCIRKKP